MASDWFIHCVRLNLFLVKLKILHKIFSFNIYMTKNILKQIRFLSVNECAYSSSVCGKLFPAWNGMQFAKCVFWDKRVEFVALKENGNVISATFLSTSSLFTWSFLCSVIPCVHKQWGCILKRLLVVFLGSLLLEGHNWKNTSWPTLFCFLKGWMSSGI